MGGDTSQRGTTDAGASAKGEGDQGEFDYSFFQRTANTIKSCLFGEEPTPNMKWWSEASVAVVTGGNKGIGYEIVRQLSQQDFHTVLTARDPKRGEQAVERLRKETGKTIAFHTLDIADEKSVEDFKSWVQKEYPQGITALVNNAGFAYKGNIFGAQELRDTLAINYSGTVRVCEALAPLIVDGDGRIVTVGSMSGRSGIIKSPQLLSRLQGSKTTPELSGILDEFAQGIETNTYKQNGWPGSMYGVSKLAVHLYSRRLSERLSERGVAVNVCCPGWCQTDMSSQSGPKTAAQGADTPVWLATLPPSKTTTGSFFQERKERPF